MFWALAIGVGVAVLLLAGRGMTAPGVAAAIPNLDPAGHARQIPLGYTLSGMIAPESIPVLHQRGIRLVISLVDPGSETRAALQSAGIQQLLIPLGAQWRYGAEIRSTAARFAPDQILIHCQHGVDRTGNVAAHLLVTRHGWDAADALYAVVSPNPDQVSALADILADFGLEDRRGVGDEGVGIYSLEAIGLRGGMKADGDYGDMIRGNLSEIAGL
jgi:hypothetical protein